MQKKWHLELSPYLIMVSFTVLYKLSLTKIDSNVEIERDIH